MLNYLDKSLYVVIRNEISFHYFGNNILVIYFERIIKTIPANYAGFLQICDGQKTLKEIEDILANRWSNISLERLYKIGVIVFRKSPLEHIPVFTGVKGFYYPKELAIELTNKCNFACSFCFKNANNKGNLIAVETVDVISNIIGTNNVKSITLTGGEPTIHPRIEYIINKFSECCKDVGMVSNGSFFYKLDPEVARKLEVVQFSLYGYNEEDYAVNTGCHDGYKNLKRSIDYCKKNNIPFNATWIVTMQNYVKIRDYVEAAISLGLKHLMIGFFESFGRAEYIDFENEETSCRIDAINNNIINLKREYASEIKIGYSNINTEHMTAVDQCYDGLPLSCGSGKTEIAISQDGKIRPCQFLPEDIFSLYDINTFESHIKGKLDSEFEQKLFEAIKVYFQKNNYSEHRQSPCSELNKLYMRMTNNE